MRTTRIGPVNQDVRIPQGSAITLGVRLTRNGVAKDITSDDVTLTVKAERSLAAAVILGATNAAGAHSDPTAGETEFDIVAADFEDYESAREVTLAYEVRVGDTPYLQGALILEPSVGDA